MSLDLGIVFTFLIASHGGDHGDGVLNLSMVRSSAAKDGAKSGPYDRNFDSVDDGVDDGVGEREGGAVGQKVSLFVHGVVVQVALQMQDDNNA